MPVVTTNFGGLPDLVIQDVNGFLVEPGRPDQLAEVLGKLIADCELRQFMGEKSNQMAKEHYDIEQHVRKLVEIYAQTI